MAKKQPILDTLRVNSLHWGVGMVCGFIGAILMVTPNEFDFVHLPVFSDYIFVWGLLFLIAALCMFSIAVFKMSRFAVVVAHLYTGILLVLLAILFKQVTAYISMINYFVLGIGTIAAGLLPRAWTRIPSPTHRDLLSLIIGVSQVIVGVVLLTPALDFFSPFYQMEIYDEVGFGGAFLITGLLLVGVHALPLLRDAFRPTWMIRAKAFPDALRWTAHILTAFCFFTFLLGTVHMTRLWIPIAYYGGFGLLILLLPWLGPHLNRINPAVLNTRLALAFSIAAAVPLIFTTAWVGGVQEHSMRDDALAHQQSQAIMVAQTVAEELRLKSAAVEALASHPNLMGLNGEEQQRLLGVYAHTYPDMLAFALFDAAGNPVVRSDMNPSRQPVNGYPVYEEARKTGKPVVDVLLSPVYHEPVFAFGAPVFDSQGRFAGLVSSATRASAISDFLNTISKLQPEEKVFIVNDQGKAVAHPDPERMATMADLSQNPAVQAFDRGQASGSLYYTDIGSELVAGYSRVPGYTWGVIVERPLYIALQGLHVGRNLTFGILVLSILATTLAGILLATLVTKPLRTLSGAVSRFSEGDSYIPLPKTPIIEIQGLTDVFDDMRQRLASRTAEREKAQSELARSNQELQATVTALRIAEGDLLKTKGELEERVHERTIQLSQANQNLEMINKRLSDVNLQLEYELAERERAELQREVYLQRLNTLINISKQVLAETTLPGLLQKITDAARQLVDARLGVSGYGTNDHFQVVAVSQDPELPGRLGENLLKEAKSHTLQERIEREQTVRFSARQLPEGFPKELNGLIVTRLPASGSGSKGLILVTGNQAGDFTGLDQAVLEHLASLASLGMQHITARQEAERRAQELNTVVDSMLEAVLIYDSEGAIVRANPAASEIYGPDLAFSPGRQIPGQTIARRMDGSPYELQELPFNRALRGETIRSELMRIHTGNSGAGDSGTGNSSADNSGADNRARQLVVETNASPVYTQGRLFGAVVVAHDVGERERLMELNRRQAQLLQSTFDLDPSGIAVLGGKNLEFRMVNPAYRLMTPHPEIDPLGRLFTEIWPPGEGFRGNWLLDRVRETGKPFHLSPYIQTFPDGSTRYYSFHAQQLSWEGEQSVLVVLWDTTKLEEAHSRAEMAANEARRRAAEAEEGRSILEALLEYAPQGIAIASAPDITLQRVSRYGLDMAGWMRPEIQGLSLEENPGLWRAMHLDGITPAETGELPLSRAVCTGEVVRNEEWLLKLDNGEMLPILCSAGPIRDPQGSIAGGVMVWTDIAERKRAEDAINAYARQLEVTNRELQDFTFIASHDLQEPLRKIQAFGDRLRNAYNPALDLEGQDYLERMTSASARMQTMLNDLLAYSRVTTKAKPFSTVDLNEVANEVLSDLEMRIEATGGEVVVDNLPSIEADQLQMRLLLQNLIGNALKFHKPDETPKVRVSARPASAPSGDATTMGNWCELVVEDNGIGFEMEFLERIFQPFQRLHGRSEYEGSGIGLAICRKIVDRHGGTITAISQLDAGSTFLVRLPVHQPRQKQQNLLPAKYQVR